MRKYLAATILAASTALASCASVDATTTASVQAFNPMDTVVRIALPDGAHGSGFHIGGGLIITAAHVVRGYLFGSVEWESAGKRDGVVLWETGLYDVGAMQVGDAPSASADIDCRNPDIGEKLTAYGNPGSDNFLAIPTTVVGGARERGPNWQSVVPLALGAQGGISGGPVFDADGDVVGIVVGAPIALLQRSLDPKGIEDYDLSNTGVAYMVPGSVLCAVLGRTG